LAALAGLVAGALSMAEGEYVSVSSQSDIEAADLIREKKELDTAPVELNELAKAIPGKGPRQVILIPENTSQVNPEQLLKCVG